MNPNVDSTFALGTTAAFCLFVTVFAIIKSRTGNTRGRVGAFIMAFGFCLFSGNRTFLLLFPLSTELPIVRPKVDIALDKDGNLYVASENWRVQKYDKFGRFLFAVMPDDAGGYFSVTVTDKNELEIGSTRKRVADYFSSDGTYLRRVELEQANRKQILPLRPTAKGNQYNAHFDRRRRVAVIEDSQSASAATTAQFSALWQFLMTPLWGLVIGAIGILLIEQSRPGRTSWAEVIRHQNRRE